MRHNNFTYIVVNYKFPYLGLPDERRSWHKAVIFESFTYQLEILCCRKKFLQRPLGDSDMLHFFQLRKI